MPKTVLRRALLLSVAAALICSSCTFGENVSSSAHTLPHITSSISSSIASDSTESTSEISESTSETSVVTSEVSESTSETSVSVSETSDSTSVISSSKTSTTASVDITSLPTSESTFSSSAVTSESLAETTTTTVTQLTSVTTAVSEFYETTSEITEASSEITQASEETAQITNKTSATTKQTSQSTTVSETQTEIIDEVPKSPAPIKVNKVSSPGTLTKDTGKALVDYSNASKGYISASYSGGSAKAKLRIVGNGFTCDHDLSVSGKTEYFPLMQGSGDYRIQIYEQLEGKLYTSALDLSVTINITDEVEMYLYPNKYSMFNKNSDCVVTAAEICGGTDGEIETIAAIFEYVTDNVTYDYDLAATVQSGYIPNPDSVLAKKSGICFDYASLFAAMARSQGIPTRLVIGYASPDIYHAWNEVYTEETGWITPELLLSEKGYNLVDATFYAGASDKESIAEYISDEGNYSSIFRY